MSTPNAWLYSFKADGSGVIHVGYCNAQKEHPYGPYTYYKFKWNNYKDTLEVRIFDRDRFVCQQIFTVNENCDTLVLANDFLKSSYDMELISTPNATLKEMDTKTTSKNTHHYEYTPY